MMFRKETRLATLVALALLACAALKARAQDRYYLFPSAPLGIDVNGWISNGFTYNADEPPSRYNGPLSFNDRDDEWQGNQMYLVMQRSLDMSNRMVDIGGRVDVLYGTDARFTQATGLELNQDGTQGLNAGRTFYHLAFPQFYSEVGFGDRFSIKAGHFYTIVGYETVTAPDNFFYSHAYTMQYGEPFTHTGALAKWQATDRLRIYNGVHLGWNTFNVGNTAPGFTNRGSYLGGVSWNADDWVSFTVTGTFGNELDATGANYQERDLVSFIIATQLTPNIMAVTQSDIGRQLGGSMITPGANAEWYGVNSYLFATLTNGLRAGLRAEWFRDDDGARVAAVGRGNPAGAGGFAGDFYEISAGLNWLPLPNVTLRPELRWDWFDPATGIAARPFNDGLRGGMFTSSIDAIILW